jgi:hypothetical protein
MDNQEMLEVKDEDYRVWHDTNNRVVFCEGSLRLGGAEEYAPITQILEQSIAHPPIELTLDLMGLEFLNSSGINMLSKFVIKARQKAGVKITVKGSEAIPWQGKSLKNLQRLMPSLVLEIS